jgi:hypothetical protein
MFYRIRDGCRREEGRAVPNRWPRELEGEGGTECVGRDEDKLYALSISLGYPRMTFPTGYYR